MSVKELKDKLAMMPRSEQDEVIAFLFQLRQAEDVDYQAELSRRLEDRDPSHWLTPDDFEREMDKRAGG